MELIPYPPLDLSTSYFLNEMEFFPIYQARALSIEHLIKDAISWHNVYVNQISSVIPPEHGWNKEHMA